MKSEVDYLIVGQGLAGTFLAFNLSLLGKSFYVIDKGHRYSSSYIAAGIINPLVLKRLTKTWRAEEFLEYNHKFYLQLEEELKQQYHFKIPIKKLISSEDEEIFWQHRYKKEEVKRFIDETLVVAEKSFQPTKAFKVGTVNHTSWLNISQLLTDYRQSLILKDQLVEESFDHDALKTDSYKNIKFKHLIFCEGAQAEQNPLFKNLPFSLNKGQLMTIQSAHLPKTNILKKKVFILPTKESEYKVGATYSWKWDTNSYESAHLVENEKTELLHSFLREMTTSPYKVIKQHTGIRPAVKDRRPLIGKHSSIPNLYLFNGMGSRGCFMAPLLSKELIDFIEEEKPLHPEANVSRYY